MMRRTDIAPPADHLLELSPSGSGLSPKLLGAPGGFLWWYADLVAPNGDGLVVIWSFGLPFLPGYASASRRGQPQLPSQRPSLNVSTYRGGELDFYLLQEFDPGEIDWTTEDDGDSWQFGDSSIHSRVVDGQRQLTMDLRLDVPELSDQARIQLKAAGPGCFQPDQDHDPTWRCDTQLPDHDWAPLLTGRQAEAKLHINGKDRRITGRVYHDRNGGKSSLIDLDLKSWVWGRLALREREFVYYVLDGKDGSTQTLLLTIGNDGAIDILTDATFHRGPARKNLGGLTWWPEMTIRQNGQPWLTIDHGDVVDSGPFYMRTVPECTDRRGRVSRGIAEVCQPDRIDMAHHRPLVRMRVHRRQDRNSMWLPLFTGPKQGRVKRLVQSWMGALR